MNQISQNVFEVTLAALLHDIGKPFQRAVRSDYSALHEDAFKKEDVKYAHSCWTSSFLQQNSDFLRKTGRVENFDRLDRLASNHHSPSEDNEWIVAEADRASAGLDRESWKSRLDEPEIEGKSAHAVYYKRPLDAVFSRIQFTAQAQHKTAAYRLGRFSDIENENICFPSCEDIKLTQSEYQLLCDNFTNDFQQIDTQTDMRFLEALASLINRYLWCVPATTMETFADIPLSDHLVTSAAIAGALTRASDERGEKFAIKETKFIWVSGDFAGIQNYIFSLKGESQSQLAKLLRGRSFNVSLLTLVAARNITDACGVSPLNILFQTSGKFNVLLPDTVGVRSALENSRQGMEKWIYREYFGELKLVIDSGVSFGIDEFRKDLFSDVMKRSNESLNTEKRKVFSNVMTKDSDWVNAQQYEQLHNNGACIICGIEPVTQKNICSHCQTAIEYGTDLTKNKFVNIIEKENGRYFSRHGIKFSAGGSEMAVSSYEINLFQNAAKEKAMLHYASYLPVDEDGQTALSFEQICNHSEGMSCLAALKADVDNLGYCFSKGLGRDNSLSRRMAMSRMLNWFFTWYLPALLKSEYPSIYTLFAGGDDLCLIGPWNVIIDFAAVLHEKFKQYTADNQDITLSAGIELFHNKYPVARAVNMAEEKLLKAKNAGRNRVCVLGQIMKWGEEFNSQRSFACDWERLVQQMNADSGTNNNYNSMLYRFFKYWKQSADRDTEDPARLKHRFQFIYDVNRNLKRYIQKEPISSLLVAEGTIFEEKPIFRFLPVGISIAMYKNREKQNQGD
ncbi:type III-A CRISPR-associated protein Cas10/Csm1 [bacterium]|nr:type III-A CRISPR-associated protein Cas10/Csm1 [bacterium]